MDGKPHTLAFKRVGENKYGIRFIDLDQHVDIGNDATHSDSDDKAQEFTEDYAIAESISLQELEVISSWNG